MKLLLIGILTFVLSGCAGLSINADFQINGSYRSDVPLGQRLDQ